MAVETNVLFIGVLIFVIIVEITIFLFLRNKKQRSEDESKKEVKKNGLLCRFVVDIKGNKIGESVAVNDDIIIVKAGNRYLGVPLKHIDEKEKMLLVKGLIDFSKAEEMGEKWRQGSFHELDQSKDVEGKVDEL
jgi:hypothetical protein